MHALIIYCDKQYEYSYFDKVLLSLSYRKIFTSISLKGLWWKCKILYMI